MRASEARTLDHHPGIQPRHQDVKNVRARPVGARVQPDLRRGQRRWILIAKLDFGQRPQQSGASMGQAAIDPVFRQGRGQGPHGRAAEELQFRHARELGVLADHRRDD